MSFLSTYNWSNSGLNCGQNWTPGHRSGDVTDPFRRFLGEMLAEMTKHTVENKSPYFELNSVLICII